MTRSLTKTGHKDPGQLSRRAGTVRSVGLNLIGPLVVYSLCHNAGVPEVWALILAGTLPALDVLLDWWRWRTLEVLGAVILGFYAVGIGLALLTSDAKVVLLLTVVQIGFLGLAFLASLLWRRPLHFYLSQSFSGGRHSVDGAAMEADYDRNRQARFAWRMTNTVWGITLLLLAAALAVVIQNTSTGTALTVNIIASLLTIVTLTAWSTWWLQVRSRDQEKRIPGPEPLLNTQDNPTQPDASPSRGRRSGP